MVNILIGAFTMAGLLFLIDFVRKQGLNVTWWQWLLTILEFIYITFVLAMIAAFLEEGAGKAALVMGMITGFIAVVCGVLLGRFVFTGRNK